MSVATTAAAPAVELIGVSKRYGRTVALDSVGFSIAPGELFALLGPNGAGKTTLLHILCTILSPDAGTVRINGIDARKDSARARAALGVVFQEPSLDDRLTVEENLEFHGLVYGVPRRLRRERIPQLLDVVELTARRDVAVRSLSSGMKRRLEIARALVHDSSVLLLDEPTAGLDVQSREGIWRHIERLQGERGLTVIVTTHYVEEVENCDRVCVIDRGKVVALDTPSALKAAFGRETIRFLAREEATAAEVLGRYPDLATRRGTAVLIEVPDAGFVDAFLADYGSRAREFALERSSLEGAFLAITGREIRDQPADARDQTHAFGKRGGEHTR